MLSDWPLRPLHVFPSAFFASSCFLRPAYARGQSTKLSVILIRRNCFVKYKVFSWCLWKANRFRWNTSDLTYGNGINGIHIVSRCKPWKASRVIQSLLERLTWSVTPSPLWRKKTETRAKINNRKRDSRSTQGHEKWLITRLWWSHDWILQNFLAMY